jgi:hypothetical protein
VTNAAHAGFDAAGRQFDMLRSLLDAMDDDAARTLVQDAHSAFIVAFKSTMEPALDEYLYNRA